jgi:hypothetical protein
MINKYFLIFFSCPYKTVASHLPSSVSAMFWRIVCSRGNKQQTVFIICNLKLPRRLNSIKSSRAQLIAGRNRRFGNCLCPHHQGCDHKDSSRNVGFYLQPINAAVCPRRFYWIFIIFQHSFTFLQFHFRCNRLIWVKLSLCRVSVSTTKTLKHTARGPNVSCGPL